MKSGGPWNLRGLRPEARETARTAARRSGMSVGEWLNSVIQPDDEADDEPALFSDFDDKAENEGPLYSRHDNRERQRDRADDRRQGGDRNFDRDTAHARNDLNDVHARLDKLSHQLERMDPGEGDTHRQQQPRHHPPQQTRSQRNDDHASRLTGAPARNRGAANSSVSMDDAVAEIAARQRALDGDSTSELPFVSARESVINFNNLDQQLRDITGRIEALQPSSDLEAAVNAIRADLSEIARLITGALPRRAVESLEIEVKALAQRIEHSRQGGVDAKAVAGLERGLNEVREALQRLTPAESLVGFDDAVKALSQKVDMIVAKDDPAALQQLETAIGALRGIVSHVASNETLTKVAEDVRALAAKVDTLASTAASSEGLSALESRIETLTNALTTSSEAGHAVPRELEKLLSGLIEKLEWVQLTHTDHAALAHLEDRIATLVQRFDASDQHLGHLEAVERGIADLLMHIEELRGSNVLGEPRRLAVAQAPVAAHAIERDVAEIKQSELRTQESLEAVQGTVEHVVDRLAMIESGIRESTVRAAPAEPLPVREAPPVQPSSSPAPMPGAAALAAKPTPAPAETAPQRAAAARTPIDPNLPPDHPLEPGSAVNRRPTASAAERIAASEAAVSSAKPPVIADPGEKPNFIAAARRAAQAAAAAPPHQQADAKAAAKASAKEKRPRRRARTLIVAGAAALIVIGCLQIASRFFEDNTPAPAPAPAPELQQEKTAPAAPGEPPAAALPEPEQQAPSSEPAPLPVPSAPPSTTPGPTPLPKSGAYISAKPARQTAQQTAPVNLAPNADVTGSLPHAAPSAVSTPFGDKLPATIGGPALRAAALSGDAAAAYEVAMRFADGHGVPASNPEAALWFERAAKQGLAPAQFRLGGLYEKGLGVKKDLATARDLYLAAAGKGNGKAMHNLAVLYAEGIDGSPDYTNAAHWFHEAADHGITDSQYNLGILYARGIGVTQNFAESYKWFALAAGAGDDDAAKKRDEVAAHLDQQSLDAARLAVKTWTAQPQPEDAIAVKAPPGGWDVTQIGMPAAKPKPHPPGVKPAPDSKVN
jgi:localization factor PodJL